MVDPLHVEVLLQKIPVRHLVGQADSTAGNPLPHELDTLRLPEERPRQCPTTALPEYDHNPPLPAPMGEP